MSDRMQFSPGDRIEINPLYLFRWEDSQQAYVLLYPEGIIKLNDSAGEILKRCAEGKTIGGLIDELKQQFNGSNSGEIEASVRKFLEVSHDKNWIRIKA